MTGDLYENINKTAVMRACGVFDFTNIKPDEAFERM